MTLRATLNFTVGIALCGAFFGCGAPMGPSGPLVTADPVDLPLASLSPSELERFRRGDALFDHTFRATEGLGPVYIRDHCSSCHANGLRGPGTVVRMAVVDTDGVTPLADQSTALPNGSAWRPQFVPPATQGVIPPMNYSGPGTLRTTTRFAPMVLGRGWMEAIDESAIVALAAQQAASGGAVRGVVPRLADGRLGRFGLKARVATLDDFAADAFRGDMGLTSPIFPMEVPNPDRLMDDAVAGVDLTMAQIQDVGFYTRTIEIPRRSGVEGHAGAALFAQVQCSSCHVPSMPTRSDFSIAAMAGTQAQVFTDMLLHDMGVGLADGIAEAGATSRQWRTAPFIGLRFEEAYMHDGRATTLDDAIRAHRGEGSEANNSVQLYLALSDAQRASLLDYLSRL